MTRTTRRPIRSATRCLATVSLAGGLALSLAACGGDGDTLGQPTGEQQVFTSQPTPTGDPTAPAPQPGISSGDPVNVDERALTAAETAVGSLQGSRLLSIEQDDENGWDAVVFTSNGDESDVQVTAEGTEVTRGPIADNETDDPADVAERVQLYGVAVDPTTAVAAARPSVSNGTVSSLELDEQGGRAVWEVEILDTTVTIDAQTGAVISSDRE